MMWHWFLLNDAFVFRSTVASGATSTKSHAETQTAIRGVAIISTDGNATSAIIFKEVDVEKGDSGSSASTNSATFFYDDCDPMPENNFNGSHLLSSDGFDNQHCYVVLKKLCH